MKIKILLISFLIYCCSAPSYAEETTSQKAVLITGASSGLGARMTEVLSKNGFFVYAGARKEADLKRLNAMENVESVKLDVTVQSEIDAAVKFVEGRGRGLYGLINNAGVAIFGPVIEVDVAELEYQLDVNVLGPYRVTQAFAPLIIKSKGRIVTTGSIAGTLSSPMFSHYGMSKHAVEAFTDSLAGEMAQFGVSVSVIAPGSYGTRIGKTALKRIETRDYWKEDTQYPEARKNTLEGLAKSGDGADPQAVADAALEIMTTDKPGRRYMVVPVEQQADITIRKSFQEALQMNQHHAFSYDSETLLKMLQEEIEKLE